MRTVCPVARSNGGRNSSIAAFIAVVISALISAAPAAPDAASSETTIAAISFCMQCLPSCWIEAFGLVDRSRLRRGQRPDQRLGGFGFPGGDCDAGGVERGLLQVRRQHADDFDVR